MTNTTGSSSRAEILRRVRQALGTTTATAAPTPEDIARDVPRDYATTHATRTPLQTADLLAEHLADYRAHVHRTDAAGLAATIARLLTERGSRTAVVPAGLPGDWLTDARALDVDVVTDHPGLTPVELDAVDSVVTGCALAIAETGTIVLDASPDQGRRALTLVPDHHICVIRPEQIVESLPQALPRLTPTRPQTWISGPSATSDIELDRVEGVHGPRTLEVVMVASDAQVTDFPG
ncbi:LutC/YkgG family protein [Actinacidiphila acididurans]|uniref:Lactate utilization protein C n=1 Tax=Actinacidiphila acididurans TaxID=2784346 RepID=A0ABS2TW03_9ACTN|nr:lactate utilization protein C [Actinacidiphila acididurans]MBM9507524.1 lactate utilization protein C [Actinacidiphila acididurans]